MYADLIKNRLPRPPARQGEGAADGGKLGVCRSRRWRGWTALCVRTGNNEDVLAQWKVFYETAQIVFCQLPRPAGVMVEAINPMDENPEIYEMNGDLFYP